VIRTGKVVHRSCNINSDYRLSAVSQGYEQGDEYYDKRGNGITNYLRQFIQARIG